ncbi:MAG: ABC transporter substrate-binding protein [Lachnospiraceae bacterium]|nr:ABC transporter substrate-binding protein [Lachnospiraceae bacterium]
MKKILAILLAAVMVLSLAACNAAVTPSDSGTKEAEAPAEEKTDEAEPAEEGEEAPAEEGEEAPAEEGDAYYCELILPVMQPIPADAEIKRVEDAINDHILNDLGVTDVKMHLTFASLSDYSTNMSMDLAAGAKHDIILAFPFNTWQANGYMTNLDPYLDNELAGLLQVLPEDWDLCGAVNGSIYALPCYKGLSLSWKWFYDHSLVDDVLDPSTVTDLDTLEDALGKLKEVYPEEHFIVFPNQLVTLENFVDHTSVIGTYTATVGDSTEVVNYYATDAYKRGVERAYRWAQAGYCDPEGSTNTQSHDTLVLSGSAKGVIMGHAYSIETCDAMFDTNSAAAGANIDFGCVQIGISDMATNGLVYGIAYTSENPAAAAKLMNIIWTDEFVASALIYGLEGVSYVWNEDHTSIEYPEGLDMSTVPYTALYTCGAFGNQFLLYGMDSNTSESDKKFMEDLMAQSWYPRQFGFTPSTENVQTQVAAVSNVVNQYNNVLTYGEVDPEEYLPEFLAALETAGINDIVADYQAQLDAWLEQYGK